MPYITPEERNKYIKHLEEIVFELPSDDDAALGGHLNYCISYILTRSFEERHRYDRANTLMGALEGAKLEFYRLHVAPYEEEKRCQNGDV